MKKWVVLLVMVLLTLEMANADAQQWSWQDPIALTTKIVELAVDPTTDTVYGIDESGAVRRDILGDEVTGIRASAGISGTVKDLVFGPKGHAFMCTEDAVKEYFTVDESSVALDPEPLVPENDATGAYTHIAIGKGGKLFVLFETPTSQYLLVGNPPEITEGVVINIRPEVLNLSSHGRWVGCHIDLPSGMDENDIDADSVKIVKISIPSEGIDQDVEILRAPGSPWSVEVVDGKMVMKVKFPRYDKTDPRNTGSLIGAFKNILKTPGVYQAVLTVQGQLKSSVQNFSGTDGIRVKLKK